MVHTQQTQKLNVCKCAGIFGERLMGPFFPTGNLAGKIYLQLLENEQQYYEDHLIFQQKSAPPIRTLLKY